MVRPIAKIVEILKCAVDRGHVDRGRDGLAGYTTVMMMMMMMIVVGYSRVARTQTAATAFVRHRSVTGRWTSIDNTCHAASTAPVRRLTTTCRSIVSMSRPVTPPSTLANILV